METDRQNFITECLATSYNSHASFASRNRSIGPLVAVCYKHAMARRSKILVALVGRPNVGKSTLFNLLAGSRKALVEDTPGLTRDRNYEEVTVREKSFIVVDTGGFEPSTSDVLLSQMRTQTEVAIEQAEIIVFLGDGKVGVTPSDHEIVRALEKTDKKVFYAVNKIDSEKQEGPGC